MKTGISIYLSSPLQDIERTIERGAAAGARYAFTSLHIPEDGGAVRHVLSLLSARGIALIADVGPRTCDLLGLGRIEDLRDLGLEYLRLDYGFSAQRVAELSGVFRIVVNASTVSSDEIASWREAGADVTRFAACHNFYPKPYTGLALEDIARTNLRLAALGFEIMAFVPGDANVRGPVFEGLLTVEAQRGRASKVALNMLELAHGADCDIVLVGDPDLSDAGWPQCFHRRIGGGRIHVVAQALQECGRTAAHFALPWHGCRCRCGACAQARGLLSDRQWLQGFVPRLKGMPDRW